MDNTQHMLNNRLNFNKKISENFDVSEIKQTKHIFNGAVHSVILCKYKDKYDVIQKNPLFKGTILNQHNEIYTDKMSNYVMEDIIPNFPIKYKIHENIIYEEYCDTDLFELLCKKKIDKTFQQDIYNIFMQTIITIIFLNTRLNVIHNDIKCENILVKEYDNSFGLMYNIEDIEFYISTKLFAMITDYDMMYNFDTHTDKRGISNVGTLTSNFYRNRLFSANNLTILDLFEFNNIYMNDIASCIMCMLNVINNLPIYTNDSRLIVIEIQSVFYKLLKITLTFETKNQIEYLRYLKYFFENRNIFFNKINNENYKKIII